MFKKLKQRIEEGDSPSATSTPKSPIPGRSVRVNGELRRENKWERRRQSSASLYSSRDSLVSLDSGATVSRASPPGAFFSTPVSTPVETPAILSALRDGATKDEVISELAKRTSHIKKLEGKITDMAAAFSEQARQKERLEEALQELRSDVSQRVEDADRRYNGKVKGIEDQYRKKLNERDDEIRSLLQRRDEENSKASDMEDLNQLQQDEIARMRGMLIHSQTEMSKKAAEILQKSKQLENLDKQYADQKVELEELQSRLDSLARDRSKYESREKQLTSQVTNLEREKTTLKMQLSDTINELNEVSSDSSNSRSALARVQDELSSLRQTYNLFKTKASDDSDRKDREIILQRERISDLEQRLEDSKLSENDQVKAIEKERSLLEKRLQEARDQLSEMRTHTNDKVNTLGSLVSGLDEQVKEKEEQLARQREASERQQMELLSKLKVLEDRLFHSQKSAENSLSIGSTKVESLQEKIKEQDSRIADLRREKVDLEETVDRLSLLETQNKHLEQRLHENTKKYEEERNVLEEKVRELQSETVATPLSRDFVEEQARRSSYRQEHASRLKVETLESKVEEQDRRIGQYKHRLEDVTEEKDQIQAELSLKDEECKQASLCLEDAMKRTNELRDEIATLEESLRERDDLIMCIKETSDTKPVVNSVVRSPNLESVLQEELRQLRETFHERETALLDREEEISQLRHIINEREAEINTYLTRIKDFEDNNKSVPSNRFKTASETRDLQKTVARLSGKVQELEGQLREKEKRIESLSEDQLDGTVNDSELLVANRSLQAELEEANMKLKTQHQKFLELKKACQKELKLNIENEAVHNSSPMSADFSSSPNSPFQNEQEKRDYLEVNFKYLKHVILKYMCSTNDQSRQLIGVISHLLQFSSREQAIVKSVVDWKLPLEK